MSDERKVALVTGAARGIGAACAKALDSAGFRVVVHYRSDAARAESVANSLSGAMLARADLTSETECTELIQTVKEELGGIDVLVNNAGMAIDQLLPFAKLEDFDKLIATNLRPVFLSSKLSAKLMIRKKWGRIVNLSSVVGYTGNPGQSMYVATKAAITGFTKSIAAELAPFGILANCVAPGFIDTEMTQVLPENVRSQILTKVPLGRLGTAEEIAGAVAFLASPAASYITGSTIHVNGGMYTQ